MGEIPKVVPVEEIEAALAKVAPDIPKECRCVIAKDTPNPDPETLRSKIDIYREFAGLSQAERDGIRKEYYEERKEKGENIADELYHRGQRLFLFESWRDEVEK